MTINWVIPPFNKGSGGHATIFRFVHYLEQEGFDCCIIIVDNESPLSKEKIKTQINEWFFPFKGQVYVGMEEVPPASITIATAWSTAYYVRDFQSTLHRIYFVQDFEPNFHAVGSQYAWAEEIYRFGFIGITAGTWLKEKLAIEYGMKTKEFLFSFDRDKYFQRSKKPSQVRQVFFMLVLQRNVALLRWEYWFWMRLNVVCQILKLFWLAVKPINSIYPSNM